MLTSKQKEGEMAPFRPTRRQFLQVFGGAGAATLLGCDRPLDSNEQPSPNQVTPNPQEQTPQEQTMVTLYTFGDSILDCGYFNEFGIHPGQLIVQNDDRLFPEFQGQDLSSQGPVRLDHRAQSGATVDDLPSQIDGLPAQSDRGHSLDIALLTIGGNDLLQGLIQDAGPGIQAFAEALDAFVQQLPIRPVLLGSVYDPTVGDDSRNFVGIDAAIARQNLQRINTAIQDVANRYGDFVDLYAHFLTGDSSWFTATIEPSLRGASEVRRAFLPYVLSQI